MKDLERTDTRLAQERAILVGVLLPDRQKGGHFYDPLRELQNLAEAAGAEVIDKLLQKRTRICSATYIGKGKLEELAARVVDKQANVIIFDNELTPSQIRDIEEVAKCKVLDRTELILDIFAGRAQTAAARVQVELAQLEYTAPRLRGMWTHLERIAGAGGGTAAGAVGGIGTRGPGETQIEIDRRIVQQRKSYLKRQLAEIDKRKLREVEARSDYFTVSLVGYTNAGKSTLMNALTGAGAYVEDQLFATLDTLTRQWSFEGGQMALLSDTVGFVRDLPHQLVASFKATLEEAINADLLLHVVDASSEDADQQIRAVDDVLTELGCGASPQIVVLNKIDRAPDTAALAVLLNNKPAAVQISAKTGDGLDALRARVLEYVRKRYVLARVQASPGNGKLLAYLNQYGHVLKRAFVDDRVEMEVRLPVGEIGRIRAMGATIVDSE